MHGNRHAKLLGLGGLFIVASLVVGVLACLRTANAEKTTVTATGSPAKVAARTGAAGAAGGTGGAAKIALNGPRRRVASDMIAPPHRPGTTGLRALTPVQEYNISGLHAGPVRISGVTYPDSVRFTCDSGDSDSSGDLDYAVSGFGSLTATVGIPDADTKAAGGTMTVTFLNNGSASQSTTPVTISPGHAQSVHVTFRHSSQLVISCSAMDADGRHAEYMELALGNATVGPQR
ncbi:MAG: hypothetical protein JO345_40760 [Streptosporangiaceae bacterium]|nr:hypothetical protein [Streptosporangiaceae bacterium]